MKCTSCGVESVQLWDVLPNVELCASCGAAVIVAGVERTPISRLEAELAKRQKPSAAKLRRGRR